MIYVPGLLVGELSGKAGHTVASKGPFGNWISVNGRHTVPVTKYSQGARASFYNIQKLFATLGPSDLDDWTALGEAILISGRLGRNYTLTAASVFCQINRNLFTIGQPYVTTAPAIAYPADLTSLAFTAVAEPTGPFELDLDSDPDVVPADTYFAVYGQKPRQSQSQKFTKRGWKLLQVVNPGDSTVLDIASQYLARFHGWFPLQTMALSIIPVSSAGFQGNRFTAWVLSS